jgi:hypothetical protein
MQVSQSHSLYKKIDQKIANYNLLKKKSPIFKKVIYYLRYKPVQDPSLISPQIPAAAGSL